jgi:hypothetical protein
MLLSKSVRAAIENLRLVKGFGANDANNLSSLLKSAQTHSVQLLYGAAAMSGVLFVVMIVLIIQYRDDVKALTTLSTVFGTSIAGLITLVVRMSKSVTQAGILLAMVSQLPDEDVLEAMKALLRADGATNSPATAVPVSREP